MSDDEHQFESKADAGASKTFPSRPVPSARVPTSSSRGGPASTVTLSVTFVAIDIFTGKKLEDIVPSSHNCDVPEVVRTDYQLIDISEDGFTSLLTDSGDTKDDLRLPTDDALLKQLKEGFTDGKDLVVTVMSPMGVWRGADCRPEGYRRKELELRSSSSLLPPPIEAVN
ncbi:hypothetical protein KC19_6G057800 [Ceratodon purpureus]|uniref:Translation initiation factor 5A C-terminal domain-containing protein n=1 Tax=Ceratodon purpureus TaxID=3225 RepID=A0A8T0HDJ1_CERPU|nr:hypothetical protein KC19_6G057800 [Ceratodon purpureus]